MDYLKIEWIPCNHIKARHSYLPTEKTAHTKYQILQKTHKPFIHAIRNKKGKLLLYKGIEAYSIIKAIQPTKTIPVYIVDIPKISKLEWTFMLLQSCFLEKVYFKIKHEYITMLLKETKNNVEKISAKSGSSRDEILKYKIDDAIPDKYKELAILNNRQKLVNEICRHPKLRGYKTLLYRAVFQERNRLTHEKLRTFLKFLEAGFQLNVNSILALPTLNKVVDKDQALKCYWENLDFPDTSIIEGLFYYNGEKNSKIRVTL